MRTGSSPHHSDVFSHLPVLLIRAMDVPEVAELLQQLVAAGWRPGQLRHRVGAALSQGSVERDAEHLRGLLTSLATRPSPDAQHAHAQREQDRRRAQAEAPLPAAPEVAEQHLARMRAELGVQPQRRRTPELRTRPDCSLCAAESAFFVTREVHLCGRCVAAIATGEARLSSTG